MYWRIIPLLTMSLLAIVGCDNAQPRTSTNGRNKEIRQKADAYQKAFNRRDAKALADLWAEDGTYVNPQSGEVFNGRTAIEKEFAGYFTGSDVPKLELEISSVDFPSDVEATETGTARLKMPDADPELTAYRAFYQKRNGDWKLVQVREIDVDAPAASNEQLKKLTWLIGEWAYDSPEDDTTVKVVFRWDKHHNFITQTFSVVEEGYETLQGKQIIGWDPIDNQIRSWVFDSEGAFGEGVWSKKGDSWVVESAHTLADGRRASAMNTYTPNGDNSYTWSSTGREVDGEVVPDTEPTEFARQDS